ncbi:MAG TPA: MgtC/SapB family protein [Rhodocyclaceae bacterium]|nr:MgtC/SapB family protein [Rhodocyclaceae bacterium]
MTLLEPNLAGPVQAFATSLGIGLLIGVERERLQDSAAGLRTFALIAILGCLFALLGEKTGTPWFLVVGLLAVTAAMVGANYSAAQDETHPGFTSEIAAILCYGLGAAVWFGYDTLAVMLAITTTILLYFKAQLHNITERMTPKDMHSILQFAVLSFVILPILPNQDYGPFSAFNPRQVWWMVVLISGLALAGYMALRIVGARHGAAVLGIFGGLASSTATTMMFSRHAAEHANLLRLATPVILIANLMVMVRLWLVSSVLSPTLMAPLAVVFACGILPGLVLTIYGWKSLSEGGDLPMPEVKNPTELKTAVSFGLIYALVLLAAAWLQSVAGDKGLYIVALASGLTDADASVLSTLRMFNLEKVEQAHAVIAVTLALVANLIFKIGLVVSIGGRPLARQALPGLFAIGGGMGIGLLLV